MNLMTLEYNLKNNYMNYIIIYQSTHVDIYDVLQYVWLECV